MDHSSEPNGKYAFPFMLEGLLQNVPQTFAFGHFTFFNILVKYKDDGHKVQSLSKVLISVCDLSAPPNSVSSSAT